MQKKYFKFFDEFHAKALQKNQADHLFSGWSDDQIASLERFVFPLVLPEAYRVFLKLMGSRTPVSMGFDTDYQNVMETQTYLTDSLNEVGCREFLLGKRLAIAQHEGFIHYFVALDEGDNPPVYEIVEGQNYQLSAESFTEFLNQYI